MSYSSFACTPMLYFCHSTVQKCCAHLYVTHLWSIFASLVNLYVAAHYNALRLAFNGCVQQCRNKSLLQQKLSIRGHNSALRSPVYGRLPRPTGLELDEIEV